MTGDASSADDAELAARGRTGDAAAIRLLVERYHQPCLRYARRMLGDGELAKDVVQLTFVRAWEGLERYREGGRFDRWLFTILANQCRNASLEQHRNVLRHVALDEASTVATDVDPGNDAWERVTQAMAQLDPVVRESLLLRYGEGLEYTQMTRITGAGVSALKMRVSRGLVQLRKLLGAPSRSGE